MDKALALRGGAEAVAWWAQVGSAIELVAGVALAGVATGLSVMVAQDADAARRQRLLREALKLGLGVALPVALVLVIAGLAAPQAVRAQGFPGWTLAAAALAGWVAVIPGTVNNWWQGQERRGLMLGLVALTGIVSLLVSLLTPVESLLIGLCVAQAFPALLLPFVLKGQGEPDPQAQAHLLRYVLPGLAIGILSPASLIAARGLVGDSLSWHDAGVLQALWRAQDWVGSIAAGVLAVYFLPRMSAAWGGARFGAEVRQALLVVVLPSAAALAALALWQRPVIALLYDADFAASPLAAGLFFLGTLVRVAAWVPLFALYAMRRTRAIALGELLSLPLFAALLWAARGSLTLELAAALWLASYAAYALFNLGAMLRR